MSESTPVNRSQLRAGFLIHDVSRLRRTVYDQRLKPVGLTRSQWWVLSTLSRHKEEGFTQIELARLLDVGKVTLGGLIDRLSVNGLVKRIEDLEDRRSKRVVMTRKGKSLLKTLEAVGVGVNAEIMQGISKQDEIKLIQILQRMKRNLVALDAVPGSALRRELKEKKSIDVDASSETKIHLDKISLD